MMDKGAGKNQIDKVLIPGRGLKIYVKNFIPKNGQKFEKQTLEQTAEPISELIEGNKADVELPYGSEICYCKAFLFSV